MENAEKIIAFLRRERDEAASRGDHAEAMLLNDRIRDVKEGLTSPTIEAVMRQFESALERKRFYGPRSTH